MVACRPENPPTREQLEPAKKLRPDSPSNLQESLVNFSELQVWNKFVNDCIEKRSNQSMREREEALEALLVLLYERINGGVKRADYALILIAFSSAFEFYTTCSGGTRLPQLAGLICAECTGLWRVFDPEFGDTGGWATQHPLLLGVISTGSTSTSELELEALRRLVLTFAGSVVNRRLKYLATAGSNSSVHELQVEAPEGLVVLSFGLLLCLAYDSILASDAGFDTNAYWRTFKENGMEMAQVANDKCGAFEYLHVVMKSLPEPTPIVSKTSFEDDFPYDWQFSRSTIQPLRFEAFSQSEPTGGFGAHTSIAREILVASIAAFENSILSIHHAAACDNIGVLCNLAAAIYRNRPLLCETFWGDWEDYISPHPPLAPSPICNLMDSAHALALAGLVSIKEERILPDQFLATIAPFFTLLSSLCYDPNSVELTLDILPEKLFRTALLHCRQQSQTSDNAAYLKSCIRVLSSITSLTKVGRSRICRQKLRMLLEDSQSGKAVVDGPRVLSRILSGADDVSVIQNVLNIMANLLEDAPQLWSLQLAQVFVSQDTSSGLARFLAKGDASTDSAAAVLSGLVDHMTTVVFCDSFNTKDAIDFLNVVASGVIAAANTLASSLSTATANLAGRVPLSFEVAGTIISAFSTFLRRISAVIEVHEIEMVRATAREVRDSLINVLATSTGLGQAIAYYATAPVSLSLAIKLEEFLEDATIFQLMSSEEISFQSNQKHGSWLSVTSARKAGTGQNDLLSKGRQYLKDAIGNINDLYLDLAGIQGRGWTCGGNEHSLLRAATAAIHLLSLWATHVEDIVTSYDAQTTTIRSRSLGRNAKEALIALSPQGVVSSLAVTPLPVQSSTTLSSCWNSSGLSTIDLLLAYLCKHEEPIPTGSTLDLLNACLVHVQAVYSAEDFTDSLLYRTLYRSSQFAPLVVDIITNAIELVNEGDFQESNKAELANGLLCLRLLATCVAASSRFANNLVCIDDKSTIFPILSRPVTKVLQLLEASCDNYENDFLCNETAITQVRVASGCLSVLLSIWTISRTSSSGVIGTRVERLTKSVDQEVELLHDLVAIVVSHAEAVDLDVPEAPTESFHRGRCALMKFMSIAMDLVATEMAYSLCNGTPNRIAATVNSAFSHDFAQLVPMARHYSAFDSFAMIAKSHEIFASVYGNGKLRASHALPQSLLKCFPSSTVSCIIRDSAILENSFDINAITRWLSSFDERSGQDIYELSGHLGISFQLIYCELESLSAWRRFAETLTFFCQKRLPKLSNEPMNDARQLGPSADRLLMLARETLTVLYANIEGVEIAQVELCADFMHDETVDMASGMVSLFLFFVDMSTKVNRGNADRHDFMELVDTLSLLAKACERLHSVILSRAENETPNEEQLEVRFHLTRFTDHHAHLLKSLFLPLRPVLLRYPAASDSGGHRNRWSYRVKAKSCVKKSKEFSRTHLQ